MEFFLSRVYSHRSVASDPIGVNFGPMSLPIILAYISNPGCAIPDIAISPIMTDGILFMNAAFMAKKNPVVIQNPLEPVIFSQTPNEQ